ncbi:unnamed protein product [Eruca vesicaria subsp. sativa]|uniref:Uncharacterized protein n=1 Tax=Eruca vesicaria subsp. sativa TaxID=29727 RepID=A0ABC8L319_ERUVS|nr:unnamed protein product [Eruca vesicaria subsp. sativa]
MATFINLEDSPMFQKQVCSLEGTAEELKDCCQKLYKGVKKFMGVLGEASKGESAFADCLEQFGAGHDDPVEHVLLERLMNFINVDLQEAKESRHRFDKAAHSYDQSREKFVSLKKNTRGETFAYNSEQRMLGICFTRRKLCRALLHLLLNLGGGISCRDVTEIGGVSGIGKTQIGKCLSTDSFL